MQGARLEITQHAGRYRCRDCGKEFEPDDLIVLCPCSGGLRGPDSDSEFRSAILASRRVSRGCSKGADKIAVMFPA